ncbi:MAG: VWA domain-containing protein [Cyclobacteriaceae bacterium]|nr:VWA domain-containing protein [Cyclobacteriaceae bacterium SS2]
MKWAHDIGIFEIVAILAFILFYSFYLIRLLRIRNALNTSIRRSVLKLLLRSIYVLLMIVALLGPSFGDTTREVKSIGKDIFICVDLSESMNAVDVQPSRLEKVKFELKNIAEAFSSDRIGLIMFSNEAFMQCPLTYDNNALTLFIQSLNTDLVPSTGTDFGPPLKMALDKLTDEKQTQAKQTSKIIILISDGEDFGEETEDVSNEVESSGIKLFTLGVGTERGSKIPTRRGFKKNRSGEDVISQLNDASLKKLAADTGGKYFEINESRNDVSRLISAINDIEGELRDAKTMDAKANKYFYFLSIAFFLMLLDLVINVKVIRI